ncbi:rhombosortase [Shewanella sp. Isolate11]|uniref:rhombosortase n=1 Tax=Shewanella sp. Isolate11 TaxID=2908530 RepID=UPI001EFDB22A|nr:rhombosortase [Shewanella sp. Isolate11]MCG9696586.1 rhombosortase [Shewanella sp. Isolate11]
MLSHLKNSSKPYLVVLIVTIICTLLYFLHLEPQLAFRRSAITGGQWWRLITGNLLHTNHWHLLMNLAGLWVIAFLHEMHYRASNFLGIFLSLALLQGIGLYLLFPTLGGYVGLSGLLHGLFTYGALKDIQKKVRSGYLLFVGVCAKVVYEQLYGATDQVTQLIGARVATESHLVGVISGIFLFVLLRFVRRST